ncbi:MAG: hypothetical protein M3137_06235 [Actinomycetota bacterium]|nr:hypothetical protein [Actinomycetota bacterium]
MLERGAAERPGKGGNRLSLVAHRVSLVAEGEQGRTNVFDEPDLHIISFPDVGEDRRQEQERQRAEGRRRYVDDLAGVLAGLGVAPGDVERWAETLVDHLLVARRDGGERCLCSCHPRLPETDFHGYGFACSCRLSPEERRASLAAWRTEMDAYRESADGRAEAAARQAEEDELVAWLVGHPHVVVTSHGGWAPEQWRGSVEGHSFSFRERHEQWRIELDLVPSGRFSQVWRGGDLDDDRNVELKELDEGDVIAEGTTGVAGYGQNPVERIAFIAGVVGNHLRGQRCQVHTSERDAWERCVGHPLAWCPACGTKL